MTDRPSPENRLLLLGVVGVLSVCIFTAYLGPARAVEAKVKTAAEAKLADLAPWAAIRVSGQKVLIDGVAPNDAARQTASEAALTAIGPGGVAQGGVSKVDTSGVDVGSPIAPYRWSAQIEGGQVFLEGFAPSRHAKEAIEATARNNYGNANVQSRVALASGAPRNADWADAAGFALASVRKLTSASAEMIDGKLHVSGSAPDEATLADVTRALTKPQAGFVVTAEIVGPAQWSAKIAQGALSIAGKAPTDAVRTQFAAAAKASGAVTVSDASTVAGATSSGQGVGGEGTWTARVLAALPAFAQFRTGDMTLQGKTLRIRGDASAETVAALKTAMAGIDDGYAIYYSLRTISADGAVKPAPAPAIAVKPADDQPAKPTADTAGVDKAAPGKAKAEACEAALARIVESSRIEFAYNSSKLRPNRTLERVADVVGRCGEFRIEVRGYTDAKGKKGANEWLSRKRAEAVAAYLQARGVAKERIASAGFGAADPIASNKTAAGRAKNRRIEFKVGIPEKR